MVVAHGIYDAGGTLLLPAGHRLDETTLQRLRGNAADDAPGLEVYS
jgi:hypothetical protein